LCRVARERRDRHQVELVLSQVLQLGTQHARVQALRTQIPVDESMQHEDWNGVSHKGPKQPGDRA